MTDAERIHYLFGKIDALQGTVCALIATHPNPQLLSQVMEQIWETRISGHLASPTTEVFSEGFEEAKTQFRDISKIACNPGTEKP